MAEQAKTCTIEDARIIFRNFSGKEGQYNRQGDRSFAVILTPDLAKALTRDGWNVRSLQAREEGDEETPYIQVSVNYKNRPPKVVMITSTARTHLSDDTIEVLDWADIQTVDLIIRGYDWDVNGKTGTKAYLQSMYITIEEDELERKYAVRKD